VNISEKRMKQLERAVKNASVDVYASGILRRVLYIGKNRRFIATVAKLPGNETPEWIHMSRGIKSCRYNLREDE
jgi:hypothetical protein